MFSNNMVRGKQSTLLSPPPHTVDSPNQNKVNSFFQRHKYLEIQGKGLEKYLTPKDRNAALNAMKPLLRQGQWDAAVLVALQEITERIRRSTAKRSNSSSGDHDTSPSLLGNIRKAFGRRGDGDDNDDDGGGGGGGGGLLDFLGLRGFGRGIHSGSRDEISPVTVFAGLMLFWAGGRARVSAQRKRYQAFEAKLAGIDAQRYICEVCRIYDFRAQCLGS